ncbi:MAG: tRNA (guanosine(46)-N7)-methyltransferase TrmB [Bacteroidales bacterium]|nr:tRNA (guanosine(46)-N7)-methyltransferase TrmB [Bacteroidales bacterium]MCF8390528.1 tRNA (guanosine(46)-N7)-methyltransferase TrmB [Bacteroidales bacterium]
MSKNKLQKFDETLNFKRVYQPAFDEVHKKNYFLKGLWSKEVFNNDQPLVLELGCGKGEYTIGLAQHFPEKNFLGVDIKGARIWRGAKTSNEENIQNSGFLRTRIEIIDSFFAEDEVEEIWLTFPDPQLKKRRTKKRLSGSRFLFLYQKFLKSNGIIHLKTDSKVLYQYTLDLVNHNKLELLFYTDDLYHSGLKDEILQIQTFYEKQYLAEGMKINYLKFRLPKNVKIEELPDHEK